MIQAVDSAIASDSVVIYIPQGKPCLEASRRETIIVDADLPSGFSDQPDQLFLALRLQ